MKKKSFNLLGYTIDVYDFGYTKLMYPSFNGNAEFKIDHNGFRKLHSYIRTVNWLDKLVEQSFS